MLAEQDSALAAAREENSSLRKAEAKQLFGIRQVERDLDRERRERDEEREEFAQQVGDAGMHELLTCQPLLTQGADDCFVLC